MRKKTNKRYSYYLVAVLCGVLSIVCQQMTAFLSGKERTSITETKENPPSPLDAAVADHLEIPAALTKGQELILHRKGYTASYNRANKIPNWVAWELTAEKVKGNAARTNDFLPDPDLPKSEAATTQDYKGAKIDRGHMCPAADNKWDKQAMIESFYLTNICPQHHNLNRGDWKELEEACRDWALHEGKIYIVCGPILFDKKHRTIGEHKVVVPEAFFKVIFCPTPYPRAIGFIYKNNAGNNRLDAYANSVDEVERITGIDFYPGLPDEVEKKVESNYVLGDWE
ncbi:MAG: DNA/RNA non-specific endonuclease [Bacteroides sp.]